VTGCQWRHTPSSPRLSTDHEYLALLVGVLGTTISPYLFFWQSAHRIEELREEPEGGRRPVPLRDQAPRRAHRKQVTSRIDVFSGMAFSNLVMFSIIAATAQTIHGRDIQSAADAARALKPAALPISIRSSCSCWSRSSTV